MITLRRFRVAVEGLLWGLRPVVTTRQRMHAKVDVEFRDGFELGRDYERGGGDDGPPDGVLRGRAARELEERLAKLETPA